MAVVKIKEKKTQKVCQNKKRQLKFGNYKISWEETDFENRINQQTNEIGLISKNIIKNS